MEGKDIDRFVKDSIETSANTAHPERPDHEKNWLALEATLNDEPERKRTWLYVAAAAIALLLFSNFYWMLEQRSHNEQIAAIVFEYDSKLSKENASKPELESSGQEADPPIPQQEKTSEAEERPDPQVEVIYVDRIVEVPVEVPVYIEIEKPMVAETLDPEALDPPSPTEKAEPEIQGSEHLKDLIPESPSSGGKKKKSSKNNSQRSFGLKLALNQK